MKKENLPPIDIRPDHWVIVRDILRRHVPDCDVWAFGSRAVWTAKPYSDLDLAVSCAAPLSLEKLGALRDAFSESDLPWKVDVVDLATVDAAFRKIIDAGKVEVQRRIICKERSHKMACYLLSELTAFTRDGEWGSGEPGLGLLPVRIIRGTDFEKARFGDISSFPTRYVHEDIVDRKALRENDILIETAGGTKDQPTGRTLFVSAKLIAKSSIPILCASFSRFLRINSKVNARYLFWLLQNEYLTGALLPYHVQHTGVARFQYTQFANSHSLEVVDHEKTQHAIASVLSALDDKIELNRRMNETLEQMAQAIFKDWFVDFGPIRRKQEGARDPIAIMGGLVQDVTRATELAALFPDAFGDDGLPEGWTQGTLSQVAVAIGNTIDPTTLASVTPYIGLEHMPRKSIMLDSWGTSGSVTSNKTRFEKGQILFGKLRPYFHKVGIAAIDGVSSTDIVVLDSKRRADRPLLACCVSSDEFIAYTDKGSDGTKMPRTSWPKMKTYGIALAPESVRDAFGEIAQPIHQQIIASIAENRTLAETRDYLLSKLMSGEVRMRSAIQFCV